MHIAYLPAAEKILFAPRPSRSSTSHRHRQQLFQTNHITTQCLQMSLVLLIKRRMERAH